MEGNRNYKVSVVMFLDKTTVNNQLIIIYLHAVIDTIYE